MFCLLLLFSPDFSTTNFRSLYRHHTVSLHSRPYKNWLQGLHKSNNNRKRHPHTSNKTILPPRLKKKKKKTQSLQFNGKKLTEPATLSFCLLQRIGPILLFVFLNLKISQTLHLLLLHLMEDILLYVQADQMFIFPRDLDI